MVGLNQVLTGERAHHQEGCKKGRVLSHGIV
jgi:hypothetical protein